MRVIIQADLTPISQRLTKLAGKMDDLKPVMASIGAVLEGSTRLRIAESKADADGKAWADLASSTKAAKGNKGSILVHRGTLMRGITYEASKDSVIVGSGQLYAKWHQEGTAKMPARPFLGVSATDYQDVDDLLSDWLNGLTGA